jgi:MFS-type transporter involved in bile tolerance (Atg22 family)
MYPAAQGMYTFSGTGGATMFVAIVGVLVNVSGGNIKVVFYSAAVLAFINLILVIARVRVTPEEAAAVNSAE